MMNKTTDVRVNEQKKRKKDKEIHQHVRQGKML